MPFFFVPAGWVGVFDGWRCLFLFSMLITPFQTMTNWYYYSIDGAKIGVSGVEELKQRAKLGMITPDTIIENEEGKQALAGKLKGLTFAEVGQSKPIPVTVPSKLKPMETNPFTASILPKVSATVAVHSANSSLPSSQVASPQGYDYRRIASLHRLSTWSILVFILVYRMAIILTNSSEIPLVSLGVLIALGAISFSIVCMVRLARSIQCGVGAIVALAICLPLPPLCLVPLIVVYFRAGRVLKQAGYKVGLVGADMRQFGDSPSIPNGVQTLLLVSALVVGSVFVGVVGSALHVSPTDIRNFDFSRVAGLPSQTHRDDEYRFSFSYPGGWQSMVRPVDIPNSLVIVGGQIDDGISPHVNVAAEPVPPDVSNDVLFNIPQAVFQRGLENRGLNNVQIKDYGIREIGGKESLFCHYQATTGNNNSMETLQFSFIYNGEEITITAADSQANFGKNRPAFDSIISSFQFD